MKTIPAISIEKICGFIRDYYRDHKTELYAWVVEWGLTPQVCSRAYLIYMNADAINDLYDFFSRFGKDTADYVRDNIELFSMAAFTETPEKYGWEALT